MNRHYVLWSGGLDSTYLIQYLLDKDPENYVIAGYIRLENNDRKIKMELRAIKKLVPLFEKKYQDRFKYAGEMCAITILKANEDAALIQIPCWLSAAFLSLPNELVYGSGNCIKYLALGYVMNDCVISYLEEIRQLWQAFLAFSNNMLMQNPPEVIFPLTKWPKRDIASWIDSAYKEHVVWCEKPKGRKFEQCGECETCSYSPIIKAQKAAVTRLTL